MQTEAMLITTNPTSAPEPFALVPMGMEVTGRPTLDQWIAFGRKLYALRTGLQWAIGDWIIYGESRGDWGERYDQAVSLFDYPYDYLYNLVSVARKFPPHARVSLSWSHHQAAASLPPEKRAQVLAQASEKRLPRDEVRAMVAAIKKAETPAVEPPEPPAPPVPAIVVPPPPEPSGNAIRGHLSVLSVDPLTGDMLINNLELARALKRGDFVEFIVYQKEKSS